MILVISHCLPTNISKTNTFTKATMCHANSLGLATRGQLGVCHELVCIHSHTDRRKCYHEVDICGSELNASIIIGWIAMKFEAQL